jgi:putative membrane protein
MVEENTVKKRSIKQYVGVSLGGFTMGVANVIPGVSGGTMAFILGIYEELIGSIRQFASVDTFKMALKLDIKGMFRTLPWPFLLALGIGILIAFGSVAKLFTWLLDRHPSLTYAFFFGLVLASIFTVMKKVKKWSFSTVTALIIGAVVTYLLVTLVPVKTPNTWWFSLISGMIVICAMILPGISGSFLLLVLRQYRYVWGSVGALMSGKITLEAVSTVLWVGIGCAIGLGSFVHLLNWLFKKFHDLTVATLIGFMIGSMWKLWPWKQILLYSVKTREQLFEVNMADPGSEIAINTFKEMGAKVIPLVEQNIRPVQDNMFFAALGLAIVGFLIVIVMEYVAGRKEAATTQESAPAAE